MDNKIQCFGMSNVGNVREHNEDYYIADPENHIYIIADGVGGGLAGEVASKNAAELIYKELIKSNLSFSKGTLLEKITYTNQQIINESESNHNYKGMSTTLVVLWGNKENYLLCNVGDSRAYLYRNETLKQITSDHSVVQALIELGEISKEEARTHHLKHFVTQVIGTEDLKPDIYEITLLNNDLVLLCTDGLTDMIPDAQISSIIQKEGTLEKISKALTEKALDNGGVDNITHVLIMIN